MWKKAALNLLCNICLFICLIGVYYGFSNKLYEFVLAGGFGAVIFIMLKIRLIKGIKNSIKKP
jgi:TctA family transporter